MIVGNDVLTVLSNAKIDGNRLVMPQQLERKLYERTNKVLVAAGGKWTTKVKAHVFAEDPVEVIDRVILTGAIDIPTNEFGYFPSPPAVVGELLKRADLQPHHIVLEPSAGQGAIAGQVALVCKVDCVELLPANVAVLQRLRDDAPTTWSGTILREGDFLSMTPDRIYDRVIMNPPFARQADARHVTHALEWLKPAGRLVAVMAAGVTFRGDRIATQFRALVEDHGGAIEALPDGSFKASGTSVSSVVVTIPVER